jgi:hypothetical protein
MALINNDVAKQVFAQMILPSQSSSVADANSRNNTAVATIDIDVPGLLNHRARIHALPVPPNNTLIPNPRVGDIALVYITDDAAGAVNPTGFAMFVYTATVTAAGAVSGSASWRQVTVAAS